MGGLGVISTGFLVAGAALSAVPIVIHLLFRRKAPRINVGSLRFLKVAIRDNAHRRKIRRWLLLSLRVAGLLLLGLLFARPYRSEPELRGEDREVAILIDRSASMGAGSQGRTPFARARDSASKLLSTLPEGTAVHLALFDQSGVIPIASGKIDDVPKSAGSSATDFAKGVDWARDCVVQSRRKLREVHIVTDLQRNGLDHPPAEEFPEGVKVDVVDVGRILRGNLGVDEARVISAEIRPASPVTVSAVIFNAGSFPVRDVPIRLTLEGGGEKIQLTETITIEGSARREVRFRPKILKPALYRGSVEILAEDELAFDNQRWIAFEARSPESVLLVDGEPGATVFANETYFLEAALRLRLPQAGPSVTPYEPRRIAWDGGANWPPLLTAVRVVILANVADVPANVAASLRSFVEGGGSLVIFSGDRGDLRASGSLGKAGLLPAEVDGAIDGPIRFDSWERDHPIFAPFSEAQHGDLRSLSFLRIARLKPLTGSKILATATGGQPILVETKLGEGKILQWASAADNDWGDWAVQRLYLPVIHQMMGYLTNRLPGSGPVEFAAIGAENSPGIEPKVGGLVVRNVDPSESRIERATLAEFRSSLRLPIADTNSKSSKEGSTIEPPPGSLRPGELWRTVAWVLLIVLVAETFLANRTSA
jgi:Aerotolerance regulator N-terminal